MYVFIVLIINFTLIEKTDVLKMDLALQIRPEMYSYLRQMFFLLLHQIPRYLVEIPGSEICLASNENHEFCLFIKMKYIALTLSFIPNYFVAMLFF